ncbi:MAG: hypothetical protein H6R07_3441 [Proteobacteria bacterium]|nr:hypothetical protein [Pseudomonadota bacterium]
MPSKILVAAIWLCTVSGYAGAAEPLRLVTFEYPPYIKQVGNGAQGLTVDIVNEVFLRLGKPISIEFYPWVRALKMIDDGTADGLFTIKKTPERETSMLFPIKPLLSQDYVFFALKDSKFQFDGHFSSIAGARIGVVHTVSYGARFDEAVRKGEIKSLDPANNYVLTFRKLLGGRVDAVICSRLVGLDILKNMDAADKVQISGPATETAVSYLVFTLKKDHRNLAAEFDRVIESMEKEGAIKRIFRNYNLPYVVGQ